MPMATIFAILTGVVTLAHDVIGLDTSLHLAAPEPPIAAVIAPPVPHGRPGYVAADPPGTLSLRPNRLP